MKAFDLTPDPKVLIALTHTPLKPLDALCEVIDNAVDSFEISKRMGEPISHPIVIVSLPSNSELSRNEGVFRVRDNGIGMSAEMTEAALRAGFSGNNPYDSLGLFGMGLNIATGKLGSCTTLITAQKSDDYAIKVAIDLIAIQENRSFSVTPERIEKPTDFDHGTFIEISKWWPEGNANYGFIRKLVSYGKPKVRSELGKRYSSLLKSNNVRISVNDEASTPYEHCIWGDERFVERRSHDKIYAVKRFSNKVGSQTRCTQCYALVQPPVEKCPVCSSFSLRTIEETIRGWVGIQRYDDATHFGIDLIRNGRAIRLLEKNAFFEFDDEFGNTIKDYPTDNPYGRIVGEVHLDHVPVDFMKQDFQRSSPEWQRAMSFLRGESSLQPNQPGADQNTSPVYMLYQGYRRVRNCGKHDMYMGYWDEQTSSSKRIDRKTEKEFLARFTEREAGFYDDSEWWKHVESADSKPVEQLVECPSCQAENLQSTEQCQVCSHVIVGKQCVECKELIVLSASSCPVCAASQVPEVEEPWACQVCGNTNQITHEKCFRCESIRGTPNPLSAEYLKENSDRDEGLSIPGCSIQLADGTTTMPIDVDCFCVHKPMISNSNGGRLPLVIQKTEKIEVFLDKQHPVFLALNAWPEQMVAGEVAYFLHVSNGRLSGTAHQKAHTLSALSWGILNKFYSETLSDSSEQVKNDVINLFSEITAKLPYLLSVKATDIFEDLSESEKKDLVEGLIENDKDISELGEMKTSGQFLKYISPSSVINVFNRYPTSFFDGAIWKEPYKIIPDISESIMDSIRHSTQNLYVNCLQDCVGFLEIPKPDKTLVQRTRSSLRILQRKLSD